MQVTIDETFGEIQVHTTLLSKRFEKMEFLAGKGSSATYPDFFYQNSKFQIIRYRARDTLRRPKVKKKGGVTKQTGTLYCNCAYFSGIHVLAKLALTQVRKFMNSLICKIPKN